MPSPLSLRSLVQLLDILKGTLADEIDNQAKVTPNSRPIINSTVVLYLRSLANLNLNLNSGKIA